MQYYKNHQKQSEPKVTLLTIGLDSKIIIFFIIDKKFGFSSPSVQIPRFNL